MSQDQKNPRSIVLAGGGTAGHVNPLLATAGEIQQQSPQTRLTIVGTEYGLEKELVPAAGYELRTISRVPFPRRINAAALKFFSQFRDAISQAGEILDEVQADTVVGFGGYVSPPVYLAARKRKLRIVVHEGNARPGIANRLGARFAQFVALSFQSTPLRAKRGKTVLTGLPIRFEIRDLANTLQQQTADALRNQMAVKYDFDPALPVLVVTGGSLGAQHINEVVAQCAQEILDRGFQVLHLTGKDKSASVKAQIAGVQGNYRVLEYVTEMNEIYAFADLIISRSGAGMVSEICALGIPAVFVPLPIGNGEQALNAADVVASGGAILITDANFTPDELRRQVLPLLNHDLRKQMASRMRQVTHADAAGQLAAIILQ